MFLNLGAKSTSSVGGLNNLPNGGFDFHSKVGVLDFSSFLFLSLSLSHLFEYPPQRNVMRIEELALAKGGECKPELVHEVQSLSTLEL